MLQVRPGTEDLFGAGLLFSWYRRNTHSCYGKKSLTILLLVCGGKANINSEHQTSCRCSTSCLDLAPGGTRDRLAVLRLKRVMAPLSVVVLRQYGGSIHLFGRRAAGLFCLSFNQVHSRSVFEAE
jgi:hypothetical protein